MSNRSVAVTNWQRKPERADFVIIGNGVAGVTAALEVRNLAPDASIVIITEQNYPTISTPALKQFAIGKVTQEQLLAYPSGTERMQRIHIINARVEHINAQGKFVELRGGYGFGYGTLLIATGSVPNGLPSHLPGRDFDGVLTLHNLQDYLNLRRRIEEVNSAVVIGGGTHAIETAMSLLHYGIKVHWLIRSETFLSQMLDDTASQMVLDNVRNAGVKVCTGTEVIGIVGRVGSVAGVVTNHHKMIPCQLVLSCTGTSPVTTLAEQCDMPMLHNRGIFVDERFCTSVPDVYAAGDVAAQKNPLTGFYETHAQWYAAVSQGRTVAAAMTGHDELAAKTAGVSWHATHLGELFMLAVGNPINQCKDGETLMDSGKKKYCRMSILDDQLIGYLSLGTTQPDSLAIKRIIDEGIAVHDAKKALLKGSFDARRYLSGRRVRTVREMVTSGKIPAVIVKPVQYLQRLPLLPAAMSAQRVLDALQPVSRSTAPLISLDLDKREVGLSQEPGPPVHAGDQQTIHHWEDLRTPVTGEQPVLIREGITTKLLTLPSRPGSRNLWAYSAELPVVTGALVVTGTLQEDGGTGKP